LSSCFQAIQLRHLNIHQNQIRPIGSCALNGLTPVASHDQAAAFGLQIFADRPDIASLSSASKISGGTFDCAAARFSPGSMRNRLEPSRGNTRLRVGLPAQRYREAAAFARSLSTATLPPCISTKTLHNDKPRPVPGFWRSELLFNCTKGLNNTACHRARMPMPVSQTTNRTICASASP